MMPHQIDLIDLIAEARRFDGRTYEAAHDCERLSKQFKAVRDLMLDGKARTLYEISEIVGAPVQSVSARIRDLRKPSGGAFNVERKRLARGLWTYRLCV